ncbi:hypothetical protein LguiA_030556 [Lonicera macranthoides]
MSIGVTVSAFTKFPQFQFHHQGTLLCNFAAARFLLCNYNSNVASVTTASSSVVNPNSSISKTLSQPKPPKSASNNLQDSLVSFNRLLKSRSTHSIIEINRVLGSIVKMGHYHNVLSLIKQLQLHGVPVDYYTINIGINCYSHLNRVNFGFSMLGSLFKRGYEPNVVSFITLMKGLFTENKHSEAKNLFTNLVRENQIEPDVVTYGTVINGLCKSGNTKIAVELLRSMETLHFEADVYCYSMIIDSLCKDRMISDAKNLRVEMTKKGISPNVVTYSSLIHGLCNFGQWKEVTELLREMVDRNVSPDVRTFSTLVDALCKVGMVREAEDVLEVMIKREKENRKAVRLLREIRRKGVNHTVVTYNTILHGMRENGKFAAAEELFNEMLVEGLSPNVVTYNILLDSMCKNRQIAEAFSLFRSMQNNELYINIECYNLLINAACKDGKLKNAKELLNELLSNGLQPNARTYNAIINGLCQEGSLDEAKELLMRMEDNDCFPTDVTYNVVVRGFLKKNQTYDAMALLVKMRGSGFSADNSTIEMLVDVLPTREQDSSMLNMIQKFAPKDTVPTNSFQAACALVQSDIPAAMEEVKNQMHLVRDCSKPKAVCDSLNRREKSSGVRNRGPAIFPAVLGIAVNVMEMNGYA